MPKNPFKQKKIPLLGEVTDVIFTSLPILSVINFVSILTVLYYDVNPYLKAHLPWLNFWWFLVFLVVGSAVIMLVVYKFVLPSLWTFRSNQMLNGKEDLAGRLDNIEALLKEIKEKNV
jgi:hypothetical protein